MEVDDNKSDTPDLNDDCSYGCKDCNCYGQKQNEINERKQIETLLRGRDYCQDESSEYVEVEFMAHRRVLYCNSKLFELAIGDRVIVETESGEDLGTVYNIGKIAKNKVCRCEVNEMPEYSVKRKADDLDISMYKDNLNEQSKIIDSVQNLAESYGLELKIISAEWQLDRQRLTVAFSAPQRVDFRNLVRELARTHRTRIELRQISTREEAKRLGPNIGPCGRDICCSSFLPGFNHVTLDHAKTQQLSTNLSKLSGNCVRLKCCLKFEYDMYEEAFDKYPPINSLIDTDEGAAKIMKVDIFKDITTLFFEAERRYENIEFEVLEKYVKEGRVYVPRDAEIPHGSSLKAVDDFPVREEPKAREYSKEVNSRSGKSRDRNNRKPRNSNGKQHHKSQKKLDKNGKSQQTGNTKGHTHEKLNKKCKSEVFAVAK